MNCMDEENYDKREKLGVNLLKSILLHRIDQPGGDIRRSKYIRSQLKGTLGCQN